MGIGRGLVLFLSVAAAATPVHADLFAKKHADAPAPKLPTYAPAHDRDVRVVADEVLTKGSTNFIPKDQRWLQIHLVVSNIGRRTVTLTSFQERGTGGAIIPAATASSEIVKPPSTGSAILKDGAFSAAGMAAGYLLFPPAALIGSAIGALHLLGGPGKAQKLEERFTALALQPGSLSPGTSVSGYVFIPVLATHDALIVFYNVGPGQESLTIPRVMPGSPQVPPAPVEVVDADSSVVAAPVAAKPATARTSIHHHKAH